MGYLEALGAMVCIGSYLIPSRFATVRGARFLPFMGLGLAVLDVLFLPTLEKLWHNPVWFWGSILAGLLWLAGQTFANLALEELSVAKATLFFNFNSLVNIIMGLTLFHEASGWRSLLFLIFGGSLLFAGAAWVSRASAAPGRKENLGKGLVFSLLAALFWGVYLVPSKALQLWAPDPSLNSFDVLSAMVLGGSLTLLGGFGNKKSDWTFRNASLGCLTAAFWALGTIGFLFAIQALGLARAVPLVNCNTLIYAGWSLFIFREIPFSQWPKVLGGALCALAGVGLMALSQ